MGVSQIGGYSLRRDERGVAALPQRYSSHLPKNAAPPSAHSPRGEPASPPLSGNKGTGVGVGEASAGGAGSVGGGGTVVGAGAVGVAVGASVG